MENMKEWKHNKNNGGIDYLIVNNDKKEISTDYFLNNGGWRPLKSTQLKELKRLEKYYIEIMGYKINNSTKIKGDL